MIPALILFAAGLAHAAGGDVPLDMKTLFRNMAQEVDPRLKQGDYLGAIQAAGSYVGKIGDADLAAFLLDVQAPFLGAAGDYQGALVSMSRAMNIRGRAFPPRAYDETAWSAARRQVRWEEPEAVVRRAAAKHSVIMISEAHHVPETRALGARLLPLLKKQGFEYLAMETLKHPVPARPAGISLSTGAATAAGYYFFDPQLAGLARLALELGFTLVAYEDEGFDRDREEWQARNLYERVLKDKPDAKVLVWAGYDHVIKRSEPGSGKWMAQWLWELTGREPFSLYQIHDGLDPYFSDAAFYKPLVLDAPDRPRRALVLSTKPGLYPALDAIKDSGIGRKGVDGYIVHPPFQARAPGRLRPAWLERKGLRRVEGAVGGAGLLVQAVPAAEPAGAPPADQMIVDATGRFELWLPDSKHLFRLRDAAGKVLVETSDPRKLVLP